MPKESRSPERTRSAVRDSIWSGWMPVPVEVDCRMAALLRSLAARLPPISYLSASRLASSVSTYSANDVDVAVDRQDLPLQHAAHGRRRLVDGLGWW